MSEDFWSVAAPSWLTGAGTLALAAVAYAQGRKDAAARRRLETTEDRRQASGVTAWVAQVTDQFTQVVVSNRSDEPVFTVALFLVFVQGAGPRAGNQVTAESGREDWWCVVHTAPPGQWQIRFPVVIRGMNSMAGVEAAFTDVRRHHWVRLADGQLEERGEAAEDFYELPKPLTYEGMDFYAKPTPSAGFG